MPRKVEITVPPETTEDVLSELDALDGIIDMQVLKGVSVDSPGDVLKITIPTSLLQDLQRQLGRHGLGKKKGFSLSTSEPDSLISSDYSYQVDRDSNLASWEEMEMIISKDSNANTVILILVAMSGMLAAIGIATNAIHITIAGMLVAPGFMPIMRISLGLASKSVVWKRGLLDVTLAYGTLIAAAALTTYIMRVSGTEPLPGEADYYQLTKSFFAYWTTTTASSVAASAAASLAGSVMIATKRSVFTSGAMIGLALVPSAALIGMSLVVGDTAAAGQAAIRWGVDVLLVVVISFLFFVALKSFRHKRDMAM